MKIYSQVENTRSIQAYSDIKEETMDDYNFWDMMEQMEQDYETHEFEIEESYNSGYNKGISDVLEFLTGKFLVCNEYGYVFDKDDLMDILDKELDNDNK